jgi:ketosteroid isomerase-like protein
MYHQLRRASLLFAFVLVAPGAVSAQATTNDETQLPAALKESRAALQKAYTALNPATAVDHYADDIQVSFGMDEYRGKPSATAWLHDALAGLSALRLGTPTFTIAPQEVTESANYTIVQADGQEADGTVQAVWRLTDGAWKVVRLIVQ